jgi:hypothetical protein
MFRQLVTPEYNELAICATAHALANLGKNYARWRQDPYCGRYFPERIDLGEKVRQIEKQTDLLRHVVGFEFILSNELKIRTTAVRTANPGLTPINFEQHYRDFPDPPEFTTKKGARLVVTSLCTFNK